MKATTVENRKEVGCTVAAAAIDRRQNKVHAVQLVGVQTAVKAIWATLVSGNNLSFRGGMYINTSNPRTDQFLTIRGATLDNRFKAWFAYLNPSLNDVFTILPIYQYDQHKDSFSSLPHDRWDEGDKLNVFIRFLADYTLWPVRPEWAEVLWKQGEYLGLIQEIATAGFPWAYSVEKVGWDEVINAGAQDGTLWLD
jgi:hypothetical protein